MKLLQISRVHFLANDNNLVMGEAPEKYNLRIHDLADSEKPREKMVKYGPSELTLSEVVAVVIGVGTKREEVLQMSSRILKEYGEKSVITETNPRRMSKILDIPVTKACQIIAALELGRRFYATNTQGEPVYIKTALQAYQYLKSMGVLQKEQLKGLYVNSRYKLVHQEVISVGSLTANIVHPREIFRPAIEHGAVGVIIAHNHPSGSVKPTEADLVVTSQVKSAGTILGIDLLDHLIITTDRFHSITDDIKI